MPITLPITSRTSSDDNTFADVYANDAQLVTEIDARDDNYQTLLLAASPVCNDLASGTYIIGSHLFAPGVKVLASGGDILSAADAKTVVPPTIYFDDADYTIASKTQKLRVRAQVMTNATAWSSVTATVGLYPVTTAGGSDALTMTLGTVVSGSTVALANPTASTTTQDNSGDFTIPGDGQYALGFVMSAALTNNAAALINARLQTRWV